MGGGSKSQMKETADRHFGGLTQYVKEVRKLMLFDYDSDEAAFHPPADNPALFEWKRKNIENYLFIPDAWIQAATGGELFHDAAAQMIKKFFKSENLNLPEGEQWRTLQTNIFKVLDGKKILFDAEESLFNSLRKCQTPVILPREKVASSMKKEEIHQDIFNFFEKLRAFTA
jgi:hypothetical protein